jgi:gliding motility-associated-like protein
MISPNNKAIGIFIFLLYCWGQVSGQAFYRVSNQVSNNSGTVIKVSADNYIYTGGYKNDSCFVTKLSAAGNILWVRAFKAGIGKGIVSDLAITPDNFIIGTFYNYNLAGVQSPYAAAGYFKFDDSGNLIWLKEHNSPGNYFLRNIKVNSINEYIVFGSSHGNSGTYADWKIMKIDAVTGNITWQSPLVDLTVAGSNSYLDDIIDVSEKDSQGNYYVTARVYAGGSGAGSIRPCIGKIDPSGTILWTNYYFAAGTATCRIYPSIIQIHQDTIYCSFFGNNSGTGGANWNIGYLKILTDGTLIETKVIDIQGSAGERVSGFHVDNAGVFLYGALNFDTALKDLYLLKMSHSGNFIFGKRIGDPAVSEFPWEVQWSPALTRANNKLYFTGRRVNSGIDQTIIGAYDENITFDCEPATNITIQNVPRTNFQTTVPRVFFNHTLSVQNGTVSSPQFFNIECLTQIDSIPDTSTCSLSNLIIQAPVYVNGSIEWSDGSTGNAINPASSGQYWVKIITPCCIYVDSFFVNGQVTNPQYVSFNVCANDSVFFQNNYYTVGVFWDTIPNAGGCDSVFNIEVLGISLMNTSITFNHDVCFGDSIQIAGVWYSNTVTVYDTIPQPSGCDSLHIYQINQLPLTTNSTTINTQFCGVDSVQINGLWYSSNTTLYDTIPQPLGCDSLIIRNISFQNLLNTSITIQNLICEGDSILINGGWYSAPTTVYDTIPQLSGCDSLHIHQIAVLQLINNSITINEQYCGVDSLFINGQWYSSNTTIYDTIPQISGCDSLIIRQISFESLLNFSRVIQHELCSRDTIFINGSWHSVPNTVYDTIPQITGCDSLHIHQITIAPLSNYTRILNKYLCPNDSLLAGGSYYLPPAVISDTTSFGTCDSLFVIHLFSDTTAPLSLPDYTICKSKPFNIDLSGNSVISIDPPGQFSVDANGSITFQGSVFGTFEVVYQNNIGCTDTVRFQISSSDSSNNYIGSSPLISGCDYFIEFEAKGDNNLYNFWVAEDSLFAATGNFQFLPAQYPFEIVLLSGNDISCLDTIRQVFEEYPVEIDDLLFYPNAFTKNGDNLNEDWELIAPCFTEATLLIFNRWGELLFETHQYPYKWDGYYQNEIVPMGVYVFLFEGTSYNKKYFMKKGTITKLN